ncbi:MAG: YraN family protein [Lachnospiraceae bacterium]
MGENKRAVGTFYEEMAISFLKKNEILILEKNYRTRYGEIDIIGREDDTIIFFEVKYRKSIEYGHPTEAVNKKKQKIICKVATQYCVTHFVNDLVRYDVISICNGEIEWYKNAFSHIGYGI